jgi:hypothetical protein
MSFWDDLAKAAKSDAGQSVASGAGAAYSSWVGDDDNGGGGGSTSIAITEQPWFWPAVIIGGVVIIALISKK